MGTSVLTPTFRYSPALVAQAFGTLGAMFPERLILGVGTGESLNEVPATGLVWPQPKERTARLKEAVALIRQLWTEERLSFRGQFYRTENATIYDKPTVAPALYVAGAGPVMARYAGQFGDGFICTSGKPAALYQETLLPNVAAGLLASGRPKSALDMMIELKVSFDPDPQRALSDTRRWAALALSGEEKSSVEDPLELERLAEALPLERVAQRWIVSPDPEEHVERIRPYVDMGFRHLVFHAPGPDQARFLNLYADQVLPRLRAAFA
jgi:coenzyme F420-dependent glucose-6-phosphate dehydrogenase